MHKFIGEWELIPEKSVYQNGSPPVEANYSFIQNGDSLDVNINWLTQFSQNFKIKYQLTPDGKKKATDNNPIAQEVMAELVDENNLNSTAYKEGELVSFATRSIDQEGIMKVTQKTIYDGDKSFTNIQYYKKIS